MTSSSGDAGRFWQRLTTRIGSRYSRGSLRGSDTTADAFYGQHGPNTTWPETTADCLYDEAAEAEVEEAARAAAAERAADQAAEDAWAAQESADHEAHAREVAEREAADLPLGLAKLRAFAQEENSHTHTHTHTTDAGAGAGAGGAADEIADDVEQAEYEAWINSTTSRDRDAAHGPALAIDQLHNAGLPVAGAWGYRGDETAAELHRIDEDAAARDARTWERFDDLADALEAEGLPLGPAQFYDGEETAIGLYLADGYADHIADQTLPWPHAADVPEHLAHDDTDMPALHAAARANAQAHQAFLDAAEAGQEHEEADEL